MLENDEKVNSEVGDQSYGLENMIGIEFDMPSEDPKHLFTSQQYNLSSNQKQAQNEPNFITLSQITEEEKIKIIQTGFQLQNQGKI